VTPTQGESLGPGAKALRPRLLVRLWRRCRRRRKPHQDTMDVAIVHFKCVGCFRGMLRVFHMDVTKVVSMLYMLQWLYMQASIPMFHLFFRRVLQLCLSGYCICFTCCKCFIWMLCMSAMVFQVFLRCFCKCFIYIRTYIASVAF
jgi:hypothetical protein